MIKTLKISFSLLNTYRVNSILFSLKQIPILKKLLPSRLYQVSGLKQLANGLSFLWELFSIFGTKSLYTGLMIFGMASLYSGFHTKAYLHIFFFLTIIGFYTNTFLFNPSKDKYYAITLLRMNAREYALVNYFYSLLKVFVGMTPSLIFFGFYLKGQYLTPISWVTILFMPLFVVGGKLWYAGLTLSHYEKTKTATSENKLSKYGWSIVFILLGIAYVLPIFRYTIPEMWMLVGMGFTIIMGFVSFRKVIQFQDYDLYYKELLSESNMASLSLNATTVVQNTTREYISLDTGVSSSKKGFEYLNDLFIKRHHKILWNASKNISISTAIICVMLLGLLFIFQEYREIAATMVMELFSLFLFILYAINCGTKFTQALFINCDNSLLRYSFFKKPASILKLFQIRLREVIKINLLPASVLALCVFILLVASQIPLGIVYYITAPLAIVCMSVFFSVHYLVIYYLLQPYNASTEIKSGMYQIIVGATYMVCYFLMQLDIPFLALAIGCIVFSILYCVIACVLVYKFAPRTFKLRN